MRNSLPRPQWWNERAHQRERLLSAAVQRLHAALRAYPGYRNALIFGSYARGEVGPFSDLDVLAVIDGSKRQSMQEIDVRDRVGSIGVHYDLIVLTPERLERLRNRSFVRQALREGHWLDAT